MKTADAPNLLDNAKQTIKRLRKENEALHKRLLPFEAWPNIHALRQATIDLADENEALQVKVVKLEGDIQEMVKKAADKHLDGYRELGTKCADLEQRAEQAEDSLNKRIEESEEAIREYRSKLSQSQQETSQAEAREKVLREALEKIAATKHTGHYCGQCNACIADQALKETSHDLPKV